MLIEFRQDTAATWAARNPVLGPGEPGYARDAGTFKIGDGVTAWNSLPAIAPAGAADTFGASDQGALVWSFDEAAILVGGAANPGLGNLAIVKLPWRATRQITGAFLGISAAGVTLTQAGIAVYDQTGALLGQTADQSTQFQGTGLQRPALAAPITPAGGPGRFLWLAVLANGATAPTYWRGSSTPGTADYSLGAAAASSRFGVAATGQATFPASFTPGSINQGAAGGNSIWAGLY